MQKLGVGISILLLLVIPLILPLSFSSENNAVDGGKIPYSPEAPLPAPGPEAILVYSDSCYRSPPNTYPEQALQSLSLSYTLYFQDEAGFITALTTAGPWDLVIIDNPCFFPSSSLWDAVDSYLTSGGKVIISTFDIDAFPAHPLWANMGASYVSNVADSAPPVYRWDPSHPILVDKSDFTIIPDLYIDDGDKLDPIGSGVAIAGWTATPQTGEAALIVIDCDSILNAFLLDQLQSDENGNLVADGIDLFQNEINCAVGAAPPIGGEVLSVDITGMLLPWIIIAAAVSIVILPSLTLLRKRKL